MKFELKKYKFYKIKYYFKTNKTTFLFHSINLKTANWLKMEQDFLNYGLKYYKISNIITIKSLNESIFKMLTKQIHGPCILVQITKTFKVNVKNLINVNPSMLLLMLRLNNKIYSINQIKTMKKLNFFKNINVFQKLLQNILLLLYYKIKKC